MEGSKKRRLSSRGHENPGTSGGRNSVSDEQRKRQLIDLAQISALFAVIAGSTYILGLVAMYVPVALTYTHDFATAWYAVSLIPNTVVAGQGVKQLLGFPLLVMLPLILTVMACQAVIHLLNEKAQWFFYAIQLLLFALLIWWVQTGPDPYVTESSVTPRGEYRPGVFDTLTVGLLAYFSLTTYLLTRLLFKGRPGTALGLVFHNKNWLPRIDSNLSLVRFIALSFGYLFVIAIFNVAALNPALPNIEITATSNVDGKLLTHTDGFWYVFNQEGDLIAIPDDGVKRVRVSPKSD